LKAHPTTPYHRVGWAFIFSGVQGSIMSDTDNIFLICTTVVLVTFMLTLKSCILETNKQRIACPTEECLKAIR
jgi:hypothetical protein